MIRGIDGDEALDERPYSPAAAMSVMPWFGRLSAHQGSPAEVSANSQFHE